MRRVNSFNRQYSGIGMPLQTSLSNYITTFTDGYDPGALFDDGSSNNPYEDYSANAPNWLSILAFNGGIVTPQVQIDDEGKPYESNIYDGLFQYQAVDDGAGGTIPPTTGAGSMTVNESGYTDEYSINFGGNVSNVVYWGLGIGITDMGYTQNSTYTENLASADVPVKGDMGITVGDGGFQLTNWKHTSGTGVNVKLGLILKPINELRVGVAVHTPTYWSMTTSYNADISSRFTSGFEGYNQTPTSTYDWQLRSPWKLMFGVAGVIGGRGIISADYEYQAYNGMNVRDADGTELDYFNGDIKDYFKASNTIRLGAEFRVTPSSASAPVIATPPPTSKRTSRTATSRYTPLARTPPTRSIRTRSTSPAASDTVSAASTPTWPMSTSTESRPTAPSHRSRTMTATGTTAHRRKSPTAIRNSYSP